MGLPPFESGAFQDRAADVSPATAERPVGAVGTVAAAAGVATTTSSKDIAFAPSFQSWIRCRFALRVKSPVSPQPACVAPLTNSRAPPLAVAVYWISTFTQVSAGAVFAPVKSSVAPADE